MDSRMLSDEDLRLVFEDMDADHDGEVSSEELWKFVLTQAVHGRNAEPPPRPDAEELRAVEPPNPIKQKQAWWHGGPEEFRFLVRAYEGQFCKYTSNHS